MKEATIMAWRSLRQGRWSKYGAIADLNLRCGREGSCSFATFKSYALVCVFFIFFYSIEAICWSDTKIQCYNQAFWLEKSSRITFIWLDLFLVQLQFSTAVDSTVLQPVCIINHVPKHVIFKNIFDADCGGAEAIQEGEN